MKTNFTFYLKSSLMVLFLGLGLSSWGQTETIFSENMGTPSGTTTIDSHIFQNPAPIVFSGTADVRITTASSNYTDSSGSGNVFLGTSGGNNKEFVIAGINTEFYES